MELSGPNTIGEGQTYETSENVAAEYINEVCIHGGERSTSHEPRHILVADCIASHCMTEHVRDNVARVLCMLCHSRFVKK